MPSPSMRRAVLLFTAAVLIFGVARTLWSDEPASPAPLTAEQRQALPAEAKLLWEEAERQDKEGKLAEALAAGEKELALDRQLVGNHHADIVTDLEWLATRYSKYENFSAAQKHRTEVVAIQTQLFGKDHWQVTDARSKLQDSQLLAALSAEDRKKLRLSRTRRDDAMRLQGEGKFTDAAQAAREAADIQKILLGEDHRDYGTCLNIMATLYYTQADYERAEPLYRQAADIWKKALGEVHPDYATGLNNLANLYQAQGDYARAEPLCRQALEITKKARGEDHSQYAVNLNNLAGIYVSQGDYARAEPLRRQVVEIIRKTLGETHPHYALSLNNLASLYALQADYARAEPLCREALEIRKKTLGEGHPDYAISLNSLAQLYKAQSDYTRAEPLYRQVVEIFKKTLGEKHPYYSISLGNLASLYASQGEYARAEPLVREALEITRKALGEAHPDYATDLNDLAFLYKAQGHNARAEPLYRQAREILRNALGESHPKYALSLHNLASVYSAQADYVRAEPLYRQAVEIRKKALGEAHPDYAASLNDLAMLFKDQGDYARAEPLFSQAVEVTKKALGEAHPDYASILGNLALMYHDQGDYARAEPLYLQALEVNKNALGKAHPNNAPILSNLAGLYRAQDNFARAELLFQQALDIQKKSLGEAHPEYATGLNNLANLYESRGEAARAELLFRQALEIRRKSLGEAHPDYAFSLNNLAGLYVSQGDYAEAETLLRESLDVSLVNLELAAAIQSERGQLAMTAHLRYVLDNSLNLAIRAGDFQPKVYQRLLAWKGSVLARQRAMRAAASRPDLAPLAAELQSTTTRLAGLALASPDPRRTETWRKDIAELSAKKEELEQQLSAGSAEFRAAIKPITVAELRAALPADGALVDFLEFWHFEPLTKGELGGRKWEARIAAFVVVSVGVEPTLQLVDLGPCQTIREAIDAWRTGFGQSAESRAAGDLLREKLWLPIEQHLAGVKTVLISPDGDLGKLPFAALPGKKPGTYLLEDYALAVVPSAQAIVAGAVPENGTRSVPATLGGNLLVLGGIDYDRRSDLATAGEVPPRQLASLAAREVTDEPFVPLAGTKLELAAIEKLYRGTFGGESLSSLDGSAATQDAFVAAAAEHRYLHLATHGYFASPKYKSALGRTAQDVSRGGAAFASNQSLAGYHPGLLSGIVLAGANLPTDEDDGILTAEEIGSLNLSRCELVVLSACETGLGKAAGGEGLLGLQRSFQAAGAKTLVSSLWKVDDAATQMLMTEFYRNLWEKKLGKLASLRQAQLTMLKRYSPTERRLRGATMVDEAQPEAGNSPYYWAAFVLSGDWR